MKWVDQLKTFLRGLLIRATLLLTGCAVLIVAIQININAENEILSGFLSPDASAHSVPKLDRRHDRPPATQ